MTFPTKEDVKTFVEWDRRYVVIRRGYYILGVALLIAIGCVCGFLVGIRAH